jgi:predicted nucleic acid-binding protein
LLFVLDDNVLIRAIARGEVEYRNGRYVRVGDEDLSAIELLVAITQNRHRLAVSTELWERYGRHRARLQDSGIGSHPHPMNVISQQWVTSVEFIPHPPQAPLLDSFPAKDRYLAHLALAAGAVLVTEDDGVLAASKGGGLGFEALRVSEALGRARNRA